MSGHTFTPAEVSEASADLLASGLSPEQITGGALKGSLDLAAAGQLDVARASEIAGIAVKQFNFGGPV